MPSEIHVAVAGRTETLRFTETVRIGRAETNGIVLNDDVVSSEHLELRKNGDGWEIVDLDSTNGTFIDGERVTRVPVGALTCVRLGHPGPELRLTLPGATPKGTTPKGGTRKVLAPDIANRYLADEAPVGMSARTGLIRHMFQERRAQETLSWLKRTRRLRIAVGLLVLLSAGAAGAAVWQARRVRAMRAAAGEVF